MARGRAVTYDAQREAILARAAALFARQGYAATTMNQLAEASGLSKATLYHYYRDKDALLTEIASGHVQKLEALLTEVQAEGLAPEAHLRRLITRIVAEYAGAQNAHRVLTEDVRFLSAEHQARILGTERRVVAGVAAAVAALRPELDAAALAKPVTMLLFGMINWMFTWLKPGGTLDHATMAPLVADLFLGGLPAVQLPTAPPRAADSTPTSHTPLPHTPLHEGTA